MKSIRQEASKKTIEGINELRGVSILAVVIIHTTGIIITKFPATPLIPLIITTSLNQVSRFCVPAFIFISGYLYGWKYRKAKIKYYELLRRRTVNILLPYLSWSIIYLGFTLLIKEVDVNEFNILYLLKALFYGTAYGHLYFIPLIFQFYVLLPLFISLYQKCYKRMGVLTCAVTVICLALTSFKYFCPIVGIDLYISTISNTFFLWWTAFFAIGMHFGMSEENVFGTSDSRLRVLLWSISLLFLVLMVAEYVSTSTGWLYLQSKSWGNLIPGYHATFLRPTAYVYAISTVVLLHSVFSRQARRWSNILRKFGLYSFGIYLAHPMVMVFINKFMKITGIYPYKHIGPNLLLLTLTITVSYFIVSKTSGIRFSEIFWGPTRN